MTGYERFTILRDTIFRIIERNLSPVLRRPANDNFDGGSAI